MTHSITHEQAPKRVQSLVADTPGTTSWDTARERLANPEKQRTNWLATVRPDGRPHLMPVIAFWFDGAFHFIAGEGTRKGRNLAADSRCVIGTNSTTLPSLDVIAEGRAEPLTDENDVRRIAERFNSNGWPLEARGDEVYGPSAPTAGPRPRIGSSAWSRPGHSACRGRTGWTSSTNRSCRNPRAGTSPGTD